MLPVVVKLDANDVRKCQGFLSDPYMAQLLRLQNNVKLHSLFNKYCVK